MSAEGAALTGIELNFVMCRTFGAHLDVVRYPDLTVGPILFRAFGAQTMCKYELESTRGEYHISVRRSPRIRAAKEQRAEVRHH